MIFKKNPLIFGLALAMLFTAQTYTQEIPELATPKKRSFASRISEKLTINTQDIVQGGAIGGVLFGSSFFVQDPKLKLALRVLACAPMILGIFAPKKIINKVSKLQLDEARCSNYKCTGVCTECRVTKLYIASTLIMIPLYGIRWMFKKPATPASATSEPTVHVDHPQQNQEPVAPTHDDLPLRMQQLATGISELRTENETYDARLLHAVHAIDPVAVQAREARNEQPNAPQAEPVIVPAQVQAHEAAEEPAPAQDELHEQNDAPADAQVIPNNQQEDVLMEQEIPQPAQNEGLIDRFNNGLAWLLLGNESQEEPEAPEAPEGAVVHEQELVPAPADAQLIPNQEQHEEQQAPEPAQNGGLIERFNNGLAWLLLGGE